MNIPARAKLKSIHWPGRYTYLTAILIVTIVWILIKTGVYPGFYTSLGFILTLVLMSSLGIGVCLDQKSRIRKMLDQFNQLGFQNVEPSELEADLLQALKIMEPFNFSFETIRFSAKGLIGDQEVILLELFTENSDTSTTYTGCAAWVPTEWPEVTIRRRTIKDRLRKPTKIGLDLFDEERVLRSSDFDFAADTLRPHARWFIFRPDEISSFRMGQPPGHVEQWAFLGHWIVLVDQGSAYAKQHLAMAEFLTAFIEQLEKLQIPHE